MTAHNEHSSKHTRAPSVLRQIIYDVKTEDWISVIRSEIRDIYNFYLDSEVRNQLARKGVVVRVIRAILWMIKSLFLKLTPLRRLLLFIGLFLVIQNSGNPDRELIIGLIILLFILGLELKDKVLAKDEIAVGRKVQESLLPRQNPTFAGWDIGLTTRPANDIGGDLVDYMDLDSDRLGVELGDVAGKGLGAALLMAKLQATLRALAPNAHSIAELGAQINRILCRDATPNRFATLIHLEISAETGQVTLLNAGHMPPLVLRETGVTELPKGDPALGLAPTSVYQPQTVDLGSGDILLLYSDGLSDAMNPEEEFFGEARLKKLLATMQAASAEAICRKLLNAVDRFVRDARAHDDLSIVVLKRIGEGHQTDQALEKPV